MKKNLILLFLLSSLGIYTFAQEVKEPLQLDDLQFDVKSYKVDAKTDSATIELFLIPLAKNQREFKLNVFATQVLDQKEKTNFISSIKMGRILINLSDRTNYLHYLFQPDTPSLLTIKVANWTKSNAGIPKQVKLVFEDSMETGKFNDVLVNLEAKQ